MNATERMALCADMDIDLNWTMAIMRSFDYSPDDIAAAFEALPSAAYARWRETMRMVEFVDKDKKF